VSDKVKIGIIICDRYHTCAGGKCLRAMHNKEGAFAQYADTNIELVGYTTCGGCPGGNVEYAGEEMIKNGTQVIHFATGFIVGYPPCPYLHTFKAFLEKCYGVKVVVGTHPIPQKYFDTHSSLGTWQAAEWRPLIEATKVDENTRRAYD
jgi:predicted metal-binding protein